jgi:Ca-activated chloride channel family protein
MSFANAWVLVLLIIPAALLVWVWKRKERRLVLPFDHSRAGRGLVLHMLLTLGESLPAVLLAVVIVLLAGPLRLTEPKTKRALTNIELCVDVSGSMTAPFGDGTRYDTSMKAINEFLDYRKGDTFGLTFFGNNYLHWVPLTSDVSAIRCAPPFMRPEIAPPWMNGTEIGKALLGCKKVLLERPEGDRMIVMITDGDSYDFGGGNDLVVAKELKDANIVVYSVHVSDQEVPGEIVNVTQLTGGEVFAPDDAEGLKSVFRRIDQMHQTKLEKTLPESMDFFKPFCVAGLCVLGVFGLAWFGVRYTPW